MQYTNQLVIWETRKPQDAYGDIEYEAPKVIRARKQGRQQIVRNKEGKELLSRNYYYVAPADGNQISEMDKLDGELIIDKYVMSGLGNSPVLIRLITV